MKGGRTPRRLVQIAAGYARHDAIAVEMEILAESVRQGRANPFRKALLLAENVPPEERGRCSLLEDYRPRTGDVILIHYGMAFAGLARILDGPQPLFLMYHNITPPDFFRTGDSATAGRLLRARDELPRVLGACRRAFAVSDCNARDLRKMGATKVSVKPVLARIEFDRDHREPESATTTAPEKNILFVGRFAPNKNHLELLRIVALLRRSLPSVRLILAGSYGEHLRAYRDDLHAAARALDLTDAVEFVFNPPWDELARLYRRSHMFLCASLHEGFCVPLLEAMAAGLPVLARHAEDTAVAETMAGAGVGYRPLAHPRDYLMLAETCALLLTDDDLRRRILAGQERRMALYRPSEISARFFEELLAAC